MRGGRDGDTRQRLVDVATRQFAERGFKYVTVRAICREARANIAAVNYHFGDKLGLYREVLEQASSVITKLTAEAIAAGKGLAPDDRLRSYIRIHCQYILRKSPDTQLHQLMHRELNEPSEFFEQIIQRVWRPRFDYLAGIVAELVGRPASDDQVMRCAMSVHAQVIMFRPMRAGQYLAVDIVRLLQVDAVADHIATFSLAGIGTLRAPRARTRR